MPSKEVLILAMTEMRSGICVAGVTQDPDPASVLRWVRPVREFDTLLPGDMTTREGTLVQCCDVVSLDLVRPRPKPPHVEDWIADFVHHRPRVLRRLEGERRAHFMANHPDRCPEEVLVEHKRSLCLVKPQRVWAHFSLDHYSGKFEARIGFELAGDANIERINSPKGVPVTDLRWQALGRTWLQGRERSVTLEHEDLLARLRTAAVYLAIGLSRSWQGEHWPLVIGVHAVPDYTLERDNGLSS